MRWRPKGLTAPVIASQRSVTLRRSRARCDGWDASTKQTYGVTTISEACGCDTQCEAVVLRVQTCNLHEIRTRGCISIILNVGPAIDHSTVVRHRRNVPCAMAPMDFLFLAGVPAECERPSVSTSMARSSSAVSVSWRGWSWPCGACFARSGAARDEAKLVAASELEAFEGSASATHICARLRRAKRKVQCLVHVSRAGFGQIIRYSIAAARTCRVSSSAVKKKTWSNNSIESTTP